MSTVFQEPIDRLVARRDELLSAWGPVTLDAVTVARFSEALGWPVEANKETVPPAILLQLGNVEIDITRDARPHEDIDPGLVNAVNGGTAMRWFRPLKAGEGISGQVRLKDAYIREGKSGAMAIVLIETIFLDIASQPVASAQKTTIFRGTAP